MKLRDLPNIISFLRLLAVMPVVLLLLEGAFGWALLLFVGIPLPGTGAWTGTLAASLLDMDFKKSTLACAAGVLLAGAIMGGLNLLGVSAFGG